MTKDQLQKELKEKIKEGIKLSDLKKERQKEHKKPISPTEELDEGYESEELSEEKKETIRPESPIKNKGASPIKPTSEPTIKNLQTEISSLKKRLATYQDFKEADLKIKEKYKQEIEQWKKVVEKSNILITDKEKVIKDLREENKEQYKTIQDLQKSVKSKEKDKLEQFNCYHCKKQQELSLLVLELPEGKLCQPCWTILRKKTKENMKETPQKAKEISPSENKPFTCYHCQETKTDKPFKVKLDSTLIEYFICSQCLPLIKEYNEKELDSERELEEWE